MPDRRHIVLCADASPALGLGHVMRSLTLAHELAAIGCATTICGTGVPTDLLGRTDLITPRSANTVETVIGLQPDFVVVDSYHFTAEFFTALEVNGIRYGVIDDNGDTPAGRPTVVVNHNPHASASMYDHLDGAPLLLLGVRFALLRPEFGEIVLRAPERRAGTVFVALGGSDPQRLTGPVSIRLASEELHVQVAVGPVHPERATLVSTLEAEPFVTVIEPGDYVAELATAGVAVLAAGSSLLEAAALGTPTVAVIVAENQRLLAAAALDHGLVSSVLDASMCSLDDAISAAVRDVVEAPVRPPHPDRPSGNGARLVAASLNDLIPAKVRLRPATIDDADFVFALRTDAEVQRHSFGSAPTWEHHLEWFVAAIDDPRRRLLIIERASVPVGQVRLDRIDEHEIVSLAISEPARGQGVGHRALGALTALTAVDLVAHIRPDNARSIATFSSAGFVVSSANDNEVVMRRCRRASEETSP